MIIDIALAFLFLASITILWYRVSIRIPELVAIPDMVITERLLQDSAKMRLFILRLKSLYHERRITESFYRFLAKIVYRLHIMILRFDNSLVLYLKKIHFKGAFTNGNGEYWKKLHLESKTPVPATRIEEVKRKQLPE